MTAEATFQRGALLYQQQRWELCIEQFRAHLVEVPENGVAHAFIALAQSALGEVDRALESARTAVGLAPDEPITHHALALVHHERGSLDEATAAITHAIAIDPEDVGGHRIAAQIHLSGRKWSDALAAAEAGLAIDPEDSDCLNLRSVALTNMGRGNEASDTLDASLMRDPDNPYTHQARGFALLQQKDVDGALQHFQEALRRDPTLASSRQGLAEALKAKNPLYRLVLGWFLWLNRFPRGRQIQILVGVWLVARFGGQALRDGGYQTAGEVVSYAWLFFVLFTACATPFFNLLLLLHPLGRHALDPRSRLDAVLLGLGLAGALTVSGFALFGPLAIWSRGGWLFWWLLLLPIAGIGLFQPGWGRRVMQFVAAALFVGWVWWAFAVEARFAELVAAGPDDKDALVPYINWIQGLRLTAALSTWFVLFAPKGRAPRRR